MRSISVLSSGNGANSRRRIRDTVSACEYTHTRTGESRMNSHITDNSEKLIERRCHIYKTNKYSTYTNFQCIAPYSPSHSHSHLHTYTHTHIHTRIPFRARENDSSAPGARPAAAAWADRATEPRPPVRAPVLPPKLRLTGTTTKEMMTATVTTRMMLEMK